MGKRLHRLVTSLLTSAWTFLSPRCDSTFLIKEATCLISSLPKPLVVTAGVPRRMPLAVCGGRVSKGMAFLFTSIPAASRASWASLPVIPLGVRSIRTMWLSVPPEPPGASHLFEARRLAPMRSQELFSGTWRTLAGEPRRRRPPWPL